MTIARAHKQGICSSSSKEPHLGGGGKTYRPRQQHALHAHRLRLPRRVRRHCSGRGGGCWWWSVLAADGLSLVLRRRAASLANYLLLCVVGGEERVRGRSNR